MIDIIMGIITIIVVIVQLFFFSALLLDMFFGMDLFEKLFQLSKKIRKKIITLRFKKHIKKLNRKAKVGDRVRFITWDESKKKYGRISKHFKSFSISDSLTDKRHYFKIKKIEKTNSLQYYRRYLVDIYRKSDSSYLLYTYANGHEFEKISQLELPKKLFEI